MRPAEGLKPRSSEDRSGSFPVTQSTLRRVLSCRILTARQQFAFALTFAVLGAAAAFALEPPSPTIPVTLLDPVIERFEADYSVYRLRFAIAGDEIDPCHIVAWHQTGKWTVRC